MKYYRLLEPKLCSFPSYLFIYLLLLFFFFWGGGGGEQPEKKPHETSTFTVILMAGRLGRKKFHDLVRVIVRIKIEKYPCTLRA